MPDSEHERFMRIALQEAGAARAEGNMAVGGVIDRVVAEKLLALLDQPVTIVDGILYEECAALRLESAAGRD